MAKLPRVTSDVPRDLRTHLDRVREAFGTLENRLHTIEREQAKFMSEKDVENQLNSRLGPSLGFPGFGETEVQTPPAPLGLEVTGAFSTIIVDWGPAEYSGHSHTEIWAAPAREGGTPPALGDAVIVGQTPGSVWSHSLGNSATRWYWVRFVNTLGEAGPYNAVQGTRGDTSLDPGYILDLLEGEITESQLFKDLGERLNGIESNAAAVEAEATTRESETGDLFAQYTVKVDTNGYVAGYGIASTEVDGVPSSSFIARSDSFAIGTPGGTTPPPSTPFVVRTTPTTINGESVPVGTYIADAYIANGTISSVKIGDAAVDTAKISDLAVTNAKISDLDAGKITTGFLDADRIQALSIESTKIDTRGLTIKDGAGNIILGSGYGVDWSTYVTGSGKPADNADVTGQNTAASISGQGNFATLDRISRSNASTYIQSLAVDTLQIANNAVTVPVYSEGSKVVGTGSSHSLTTVTFTLTTPSPILIWWAVEHEYFAGPQNWSFGIFETAPGHSLVDGRSGMVFGNDYPSGFYFVGPSAAGTQSYDLRWNGANSDITARGRMLVMGVQK